MKIILATLIIIIWLGAIFILTHPIKNEIVTLSKKTPNNLGLEADTIICIDGKEFNISPRCGIKTKDGKIYMLEANTK